MQPNPRQPKNLTRQLIDALGERIVAGRYNEGEKIPNEAELCVEFGVSRPVMREATKALMAKGLVSSRARVGTVVQSRTNWSLLDRDVLGWTIRSLPADEFLDMLFEARLVIEPDAAALAAEHATDDDIAVLTGAVEAMETAQSSEALLEPDILFHRTIMDASHNPIIAYIGSTLHTALAASIKLTSLHPDTHALSLPRHRAVYKAICKSDPKAAARAMILLLRESRLDFDQVSRRKKKKTA